MSEVSSSSKKLDHTSQSSSAQNEVEPGQEIENSTSRSLQKVLKDGRISGAQRQAAIQRVARIVGNRRTGQLLNFAKPKISRTSSQVDSNQEVRKVEDKRLERSLTPSLIQREDETTDILPEPVEVTWNGDRFKIEFERKEAESQNFLYFVIRYLGQFPTGGISVTDNTIRLRVGINNQTPLKARLQAQDSNSLTIFPYGDNRRIFKLVDKPEVRKRPEDGKKVREHNFTSTAEGEFKDSGSFQVVDPGVKDDDVKVTGEGTAPGATPGFLNNLDDGSSEAPLDGDGDQNKELVVRIKAIANKVDSTGGGSGQYKVHLELIQVSSNTVRQTDFLMPAPPENILLPSVLEVTDGKAPTKIQLGTGSSAPSLLIKPPSRAKDGVEYPIDAAGTQLSFKFPSEKGQPRQLGTASDTKSIGGIISWDVTLGTYEDKFRLTLQPLGPDKALFGIAGIVNGAVVENNRAGTGFEINLPAGSGNYQILKTSDVSLGIDFNGDQKPEIEIFDRLDAPQGEPPEKSRNHQLRLVGQAVGDEKLVPFQVRNGWLLYNGNVNPGGDKATVGNAMAVGGLSQEAKVGNFQNQLDSLEGTMVSLRQTAADQKVINLDTFKTWSDLSIDLIKIGPQVGAGVDKNLQDNAAQNAAKFYKLMAEETKSANKVAPTQVGNFTSNPYTGMVESQIPFNSKISGAGPELEGDIKTGNWGKAFADYKTLVGGYDRWIADQLKAKNPSSTESRMASTIPEQKKAMEAIAGHKPTRVLAVFQPDEKFKNEQGYTSQVPLNLYTWQEGSTWHLKNLTNPGDAPDYTLTTTAGENMPPQALFEKLSDPDHLPAGVVHYDIPGKGGGQVQTKDGLTWKKALTYLGLALAVVGAGLATFGTGGVAVVGAWVLAGSAIAGGASAAIDLIERASQDNLDATTALLDVAQIVAAIAGSLTLVGGTIIKGASAAAATGSNWTGTAAKFAVFFDKIYVPVKIARMGADVVTLVTFTAQAASQLDAIQNGSGDQPSKDRAKGLLIAQLAVTGGIMALSIKGELPALGKGRRLELYLPKDAKVPIATLAGEEIPTGLKFSQKDVGATTGDGKMTLEELTESMRTGGWKGDPINVVELPDGSVMSLDNRRLLAAQNAGLKKIPVLYHAPNEPLPAKWAEDGFKLEKAIYQMADGELVVGGEAKKIAAKGGKLLYPKNYVAKTYGQAALIRTADQGNLPKEAGKAAQKFPLYGSFDQPKVRVPKPTPEGTKVPGGDD